MKPNLIQIVPCIVFPDRETGGVSNVVRKICQFAYKSGYPVKIICGDNELGEKQVEAGEQEFQGIQRTVIWQRSHPALGPVKDLLREIESLPDNSVAHVHTCFSRFCETAMRALHSRGIPFVFTPHGKLSPGMMGKLALPKKIWFRCATFSAVSLADSVAALSRDEAAHIQQLGIKVDDIVSNGFDPFPDDQLPDCPLGNQPYIIYLGYLDPRKQPEFVVRAFAKSQARQTHQLVFVGPDEYGHSEKILQEIHAQQLEGKVMLYGPAYGAEKAALLKGASCFCLPSKGEGQPVVLAESIGSGVPIVCSHACNFSELHDQKVGLVLDNFDSRAWAHAIDTLCQRPEPWQDVSERCIRFSEQFRWEAVVDKWLNIYQRLAKK